MNAMLCDHEERLGMAYVIASVALFSTIEVASKALSRGPGVDAFVLVFLRFFMTGVVVVAVYLPRWRAAVKTYGIRHWLTFAVNGLVGVSLAISLFHMAVEMLENAASAAVIFSVNPVFVTVLARFINNERWTLRQWFAVVLGAAGVTLFAWESGRFSVATLGGLGVMLLSAFFFALSTCISRRKVSVFGPFVFMGFSALAGSVLVLPVIACRLNADVVERVRDGWLLVLYIALIGTACAYGLYYLGLRHARASKASMAFFLKPVLASLLAVACGERTNVYMISGTILIVMGLCAGTVGLGKPAVSGDS